MPFWYVALRRIRQVLNTKMVPMLSVFAAFSFVIMMFNIPLPGGTTGHAVGIGIAAVVLGPWASMITISVALFIQAILFGDGGITTFGANSLNMAIIGSLVAAGVYRIIAGKAGFASRRRVIAAAIAGYVAINASALCAAIEFGIQPALLHNSTGTPLYAPFPLSVAIPAMMIGHLLIAGPVEFVITGGVVAYLQKTDLSLLRLTAPDFKRSTESTAAGWRTTRPLWIGLAVLMILTPLGLLAAGTAWGEWSPQDFSNPTKRAEIAAASGSVLPPSEPPQGLVNLSTLWTAPVPDYAPPVMRSRSFGYIMSAMVGTGLIILICLFIGWVAGRSSA